MTEMLSIMEWILNYSVILSAQLIVLLLLRPWICRWLGAASSYKLWLLPLIWLPFYGFNWTAINWQEILNTFSGNNTGGTVSGALVLQSFIDFELNIPLPELPEFTLSQSSLPGLWLGLSVLWLSGVFILLSKEAYRIIRFVSFVDFTAEKVSKTDEDLIRGVTKLPSKISMVYLKGIESPALYGLLHPVLLLPEGFLSKYDDDQRHIIISHEAVHLKRKDNFWNLAACLLRIVFWFNPLLYLAHHYYRLDQELSCDAIALTCCNKNQSRYYGRTLLASVAQKSGISHPPIIAAWENPEHLKERIKMIAQHLENKKSRSITLTCLLLICLAGAGLTSCISDNVSAQRAVAGNETTRSVPARNSLRNDQILSRSVYQQINDVMDLRDQERYPAAMQILENLLSLNKAGRLNTREQFVMWMFVANLYQIQENYQEALFAYGAILNLQNLEPEDREETLFNISSLHLIMEDYQGAIDRLNDYNQISSEPDAKVYYQLSTAYYLLEQYEDAIISLLRSKQINMEKNEVVPQNTYDLLKALYLTLDDSSSAIAVLEESIGIYDDEDDKELLEKLQLVANGESVSGMSSVQLAQVDKNELLPPQISARDVEMLPIVTIQPNYPQAAVANDIEGWILVGFTVSENGDVIEASVIDGSPEDVFDSSALAAISKFKFNPRLENGEPVSVPGIRYLFRYNL